MYANSVLTLSVRPLRSGCVDCGVRYLMSYDVVRAHLVRCRERAEGGGKEFHELADAIEHLASAVESDLTQIKGALSHIARLLETEGLD